MVTIAIRWIVFRCIIVLVGHLACPLLAHLTGDSVVLETTVIICIAEEILGGVCQLLRSIVKQKYRKFEQFGLTPVNYA